MFVFGVVLDLGGCIGLSFYSLNRLMGIPIAIVAPIFFTVPIVETKVYKNLVFSTLSTNIIYFLSILYLFINRIPISDK